MIVRRILIAGCGDLGQRLGGALAGDGDQVLALRRRTEALPPALVPIACDLLDPTSLQEIPRSVLPGRVDGLVYAVSPGAFTDEAYRRAFVEGLRNLLERVPAPGRLVYCSSTAVHGQRDGSWVDEASEATGEGFSARRLLQGEALAAEAGGVVLRLAGIYGPGRLRLVESVQAGSATFAEDEVEWTNRVHVDDAARALRRLLSLEAPEPVYLCADDEPVPRSVLLEWLAAKLGAPRPRAVPSHLRPSERPRSSKRCRNALLRSTGWSPAYPSFREGYLELAGSRAGRREKGT